MRTKLLATWATDGATGADQFGRLFMAAHVVHTKMAATLTHATTGACCLTSMTNFITARRTNAGMLCAGPFATSPTSAATTFTIFLATNRTGGNTAPLTENILASGALLDARITDNMTVTVERNLNGFLAASIAGGTPQSPIITIAPYTDRCFPFAVTERHIGDGYRHLQGRIADKLHLHAEPMIFDFFG